jgi:hypothetical protein
MNEEMKRLIGVLNEAGYEVIAISDMQYGSSDYRFSGAFDVKIADKSKDPSKP